MTRNAVNAARNTYEAVRSFNHATLDPQPQDLAYAADAADVVTALLAAFRALPQGLERLGAWLEQEAGGWEVESSTNLTAAQLTSEACNALIAARTDARRLAQSLGRAQQALGSLRDRSAPEPQEAGELEAGGLPPGFSERDAALAYVKGRFFPALPEAYADWLVELRRLVRDGEHADAELVVPSGVADSAYIPRAARYDEEADAWRITLYEALAALRVEHLLAD